MAGTSTSSDCDNLIHRDNPGVFIAPRFALVAATQFKLVIGDVHNTTSLNANEPMNQMLGVSEQAGSGRSVVGQFDGW